MKAVHAVQKWALEATVTNSVVFVRVRQKATEYR